MSETDPLLASTPHPRSHVIEAAGKQWIAGLSWFSYGDKPSLDKLRDDAESHEADWVAIRDNAEVVQAGFAPALEGYKPSKLFSLGAVVAQAQEQPWLGVFDLGDGFWWYLAIRDGKSILPDGDVVGDKDTILRARAEHENYGDWRILEGTFEKDLLPILKEAKGKSQVVRLKSVEPPSPFKTIIPTAAAALIVGGGVLAWHHHQVVLQQEQAARMAAERARLAAAQQQVSPMKSTPAPQAWLAACRDSIEALPVSYDGWELSAIACAPGGVSVGWARGIGATVAQHPPGGISLDGNTITNTIPLPALTPGPDDARGLDAGALALVALLQPLAVQPQITAPPPQTLPGQTQPSGPVVTPSQAVSFTSPLPPWEINFSGVPGLRLTSIQYTDSGWIVQGSLYGR